MRLFSYYYYFILGKTNVCLVSTFLLFFHEFAFFFAYFHYVNAVCEVGDGDFPIFGGCPLHQAAEEVEYFYVGLVLLMSVIQYFDEFLSRIGDDFQGVIFRRVLLDSSGVDGFREVSVEEVEVVDVDGEIAGGLESEVVSEQVVGDTVAGDVLPRVSDGLCGGERVEGGGVEVCHHSDFDGFVGVAEDVERDGVELQVFDVFKSWRSDDGGVGSCRLNQQRMGVMGQDGVDGEVVYHGIQMVENDVNMVQHAARACNLSVTVAAMSCFGTPCGGRETLISC
mgnify:CR=1 FL=1